MSEIEGLNKIQLAANKTRAIYLDRRTKIEQDFLAENPQQTFFETEDGTRIRVFHHISKLTSPDNIKGGKIKIAVYVPGLFRVAPNLGSYPLEVKLLEALLTDDIDSVVVLKAEGLNDSAYLEEGKGAVQSKVSQAALSVLEEDLKEAGYGDMEPEFTVTGYSEGSTQGASIAARLAEKGKTVSFVSIGGGGLTGYEDQTQANFVKFTRNAIADRKKAPHPEFPVENWQVTNQETGKLSDVPIVLPLVTESRDTFYIDKRVIGNIRTVDDEKGKRKITEGLEGSLGKAQVELKSDISNIEHWTVRYLATKLGLSEEVPEERLKAAATFNPDYVTLVEKRVPITVVSGTEDIFFSNSKIRSRIDQLRSRTERGKILLISSNFGHDFPHNNPSGIAMMVKLIKEKTAKSSHLAGDKDTE